MRSFVAYFGSGLLAVALVGGLVLTRQHLDSADARDRQATAKDIAQYNAQAAASEAATAKAQAQADAQAAQDERRQDADDARLDQADRDAAARDADPDGGGADAPSASGSPFVGEPGGGMTNARAHAIVRRLNDDNKTARVTRCDRKAEDVVECDVQTRDSTGKCLSAYFAKQPSFQRKVQLAMGAEYCTMYDGTVLKVTDGSPNDFATLLARWYR
jgi:hypothetical protein